MINMFMVHPKDRKIQKEHHRGIPVMPYDDDDIHASTTDLTSVQQITEEINNSWYYNDAGVYIPASVKNFPSIIGMNMMKIRRINQGEVKLSPDLHKFSLDEYRDRFAYNNNGNWFLVVCQSGKCARNACICGLR